MPKKLNQPIILALLIGTSWFATAQSATFGKVAAIGGHSSDLALDEARGVLYVANFTANRIDVLSLDNGVLLTSMNVPGQPGTLSISPSGKYLLIGHYGNFSSPNNGITLIDIDSRTRQTFPMTPAVLGVAFGADGLALIVTNVDFWLFDPVNGSMQRIDQISNVAAKTLPVPGPALPLEVTGASISASGDGKVLYGLAGSTSTFTFRYDVGSRVIRPGGVVLASGLLGPRLVSLNQDGTRIMAGWVMVDELGNFINYFTKKSNQPGNGTTAFDTARGLVYAQIPEQVNAAPVFQILDAANLAPLETFRLAENLTGKSLLRSDGLVLYSLSESGVTLLPVGTLDKQPRVAASVEDVVFQGSTCVRKALVQEFEVRDPGGNATPFTIQSNTPGLTVQPSVGVTPAIVRITVDPTRFASVSGTATATLSLDSAISAKAASSIRVLVNVRDPDQRGVFFNVPGDLRDLAADPDRNRFYVLRQDRNQVLVFDASEFSQIATLKTYNAPTSLALTLDRRYLLVGHQGSQVAAVFDLDSLEAQPYISTEAGAGNEARSIGVAGSDILAAAVDYQGKGHVIRLDMGARRSFQFPSLGIYNNDISPQTVAIGSGSGSSVLFASADGSLMLYNSSAATFTISRKEQTALSGAYAASNYDTYAVGNALLNASLVPVTRLDSGARSPSGFIFIEEAGIRTVASATTTGTVQRLSSTSSLGASTRLSESPLMPTAQSPFTRTLAYLPPSRTLVSLSTSGFQVLPWNYDDAVAPPRVDKLVSSADQSSGAAPGALVSLYGAGLAPILGANQLATGIGPSCLLVNGVSIPMFSVSSDRIDAQLPFSLQGRATVVLKSAGGASDDLPVNINVTAPRLFRTRLAGLGQEVASIVRAANSENVTLSNPIHRGDRLTLFLAGMGRTTPSIEAGISAPSSPRLQTVMPPVVTLGGTSLIVRSSALASGQIGVYQVDVEVPGSVPLGMEIPLTITQGDSETSVNVRVVDK